MKARDCVGGHNPIMLCEIQWCGRMRHGMKVCQMVPSLCSQRLVLDINVTEMPRVVRRTSVKSHGLSKYYYKFHDGKIACRLNTSLRETNTHPREEPRIWLKSHIIVISEKTLQMLGQRRHLTSTRRRWFQWTLKGRKVRAIPHHRWRWKNFKNVDASTSKIPSRFRPFCPHLQGFAYSDCCQCTNHRTDGLQLPPASYYRSKEKSRQGTYGLQQPFRTNQY